jgi:hypothetical protein
MVQVRNTSAASEKQAQKSIEAQKHVIICFIIVLDEILPLLESSKQGHYIHKIK